MIFRNLDTRIAGLPYSIPQGLPERPLYATTSPRPSLVPRQLNILFSRGSDGSHLRPGYIALIVILVLGSIASSIALSIFLHRRRKEGPPTFRPQILRFPSTEKGQRHSWQRASNEWFGRKLSGEESYSLAGEYQSRMPNVTISRPISNTNLSGPTPIFSTQNRESLHSVGIAELPDNSQPLPEAIYHPYLRSRSNSADESVNSLLRSTSASPSTHISRSRESSISSNNSQPHPNNGSYRPLARNSFTYARERSLSNGPSRHGTYQNSSTLSTTDEEHSIVTPFASLSDLQKSLPPLPPPSRTTSSRGTFSYTPSNSLSWQLDPYGTSGRDRPRFDFSDYEVLQETTQVIDVAIAGPLDMPQGPLTPFGERAAKAGAAHGKQSTWYKSPQNIEKGLWLV